jgi:hypothetical protein
MAYAKTNLSATTAAVTNRFVTSVSMKVGAYTLANTTAAHGAGFLVTVTHTAVDAADTLGTIVVVGKDLAGQAATETLTPTGSGTTTGTTIFRSLTSVTGAGWVIAGGNDTIIVGQAADAYIMGSGGELFAVVVNATTATSIALADSAGTFATLKASIGENTYYYQAAISGYLKVTHAGTSNYTVLHTPTIPTYVTT